MGRLPTKSLSGVGKKFGRILIKSYANQKYLILCECGTEKIVRSMDVVSGKISSCGCLKNKHLLSNTAEYDLWRRMMSRCYNKKDPKYNSYGGRGITVSKRWHNVKNFFNDMCPRPSDDLSLDRINNDEGYSVKNCRWATNRQQMYNRRSTVFVTINGFKKTLIEWSDHSGISLVCIKGRYYRGLRGPDLIDKNFYKKDKK